MITLILIAGLFFPRLTNDELQTLADERVDIPLVQQANLKNNDCIVVTLNYKKKNEWVVEELEVWVCGDRLYGADSEVSDTLLRDCVWRHKK